MVCVKLFFSDGDTVITKINATPAEARSYYLNRIFNTGSVRDSMQVCTAVEIEAAE